jgi:hypothetical protein
LLEVADEHDLQMWSAVGTCLKGAAQAGLGRHEEGLANLRKGMGLYRGLRSPPIFWRMLLWIDAGASHCVGRWAEAVYPIDTATEMMSPGKGATVLPEFRILKGDLLLALATDGGRDVSEAEHFYQLAFDHASDLKARMSQLRAVTKLCQVRRAGAGQEDTLRRLQSVYATFTEGFATADLIEARNVLAAAAPMQSSRI